MYFLHIRLFLILSSSFTIAFTLLHNEKVDHPDIAKHDSSILDLVFAMDSTGSMGDYINSATQHIRKIVEEIIASEKSDVRLALVEYRDHPPEDNTFVTRVHDFTPNITEMKNWLEQCQAVGGGDGPEAVADALHEVMKLSWRPKATKICILISDAPPHGLDSSGDRFPNGCPNGFDPIKTVREMAQNYITLYTVGVEPPIVPYRDFFMTLAYITGGQYVPMKNAQLLAQVVIGGVREEISLDRLMQDAQEDIVHEMRQAMAEGLDEDETSERMSHFFALENFHAHRMINEAGVPSEIISNHYSECEDMDEMKAKYKPVSMDFNSEHHSDHSESSVESYENSTMTYDLLIDEKVSAKQAKRIIQKMKHHL